MKTYEHFIFRMTVYNFYILGKNGQSIFYHEWERPQKASLSRSEEDKLMAGLIFSLSNFARKMTNEPDSGSFQGLKVIPSFRITHTVLVIFYDSK